MEKKEFIKRMVDEITTLANNKGWFNDLRNGEHVYLKIKKDKAPKYLLEILRKVFKGYYVCKSYDYTNRMVPFAEHKKLIEYKICAGDYETQKMLNTPIKMIYY